MLDRLHMHIVDILLFDDHDRYRSSLQPQLQDALRVVGESRNHAVFCTTFNPFEFGRSGFPQSAIRALTQAFAVASAASAASLCAGHVQQLGGESPLADLMEVRPSDDARATAARRGLKEAWNKRASR
jgi:hypothetical protein